MSNTINWGKIHELSYSPETNLTGTATTPSFSATNSFSFDGVDETFIVNGASNYAFTGDFTLMAWVKVDTIGNEQYIVDTSSSSSLGNGYSFRVLTSSGKIRFWSYSAFTTRIDSTTTLSSGVWNHVAVVHNSTQNKIYINGVLDATKNLTSGHAVSNTTNLRIGSSQAFGGFFGGKIDEVAFFGTDLSSDINTIYNSGVSDLATYSPVGWFRMGENASFASGTNIWTMTSVGSTTNTADSRNMLEANKTTDVPT